MNKMETPKSKQPCPQNTNKKQTVEKKKAWENFFTSELTEVDFHTKQAFLQVSSK